MIEGNSIRVILEVIDAGSYQKAADSLGYTHAGIRYIVQSAEEELGIKLFYRRHGGVSLTNEGIGLLPWLKQMEAGERELIKRARELRDMNAGTVRIAAFTSVSVLWLPKMIGMFNKTYPGVRFEIINYSEDRTGREMLRNGEVDCGIYVLPVESDLDTYFIEKIPLVAIVSNDHPLAGERFFPMNELGNYPYVAGTGEEMIEDIFIRNNTRPNVQFEVNNDYAAMALVSQGLGYCIMPQSLADTSSAPVVCLPLESPEYLEMVIALRGNEPCTRSVRTFVETALKWKRDA